MGCIQNPHGSWTLIWNEMWTKEGKSIDTGYERMGIWKRHLHCHKKHHRTLGVRCWLLPRSWLFPGCWLFLRCWLFLWCWLYVWCWLLPWCWLFPDIPWRKFLRTRWWQTLSKTPRLLERWQSDCAHNKGTKYYSHIESLYLILTLLGSLSPIHV